jgi:FkbM family methyltransferase
MNNINNYEEQEKAIEVLYAHGNKILISSDTIKNNCYTWNDQTANDLYLIERFYDLIKDDFVILDIGAQSGLFTLLSKFFPKTKWYSFEPDPGNYDLLVENLTINSITNVNTFNVGITNKIGNDELKICRSHRGLNNYGDRITRFDSNSDDAIIVNTPIDTIDNLFLNQNIDLIKIDTEGCEYNILCGAKNVIEKNKPKILLEYYEQNLLQFGKNFSDLHKLLDEINYQIVESFGEDILIQHKGA